MPPDPTPALTEGTRLGPYEVLGVIGAGGMGEVYRARDTRLDRVVAIKVLAARMAADPELRERFEREARAISSLNHPNICVLHDVGREKPQPSTEKAVAVDFLVMEHLDGETLAARIAHGPSRPTRASQLTEPVAESQTATTGSSTSTSSVSTPPMPVDEALRIAIQIAEALDRAHRQGIVHRDLKPGNVMLTKSGQVKLLDFGLARLSEASGKGDGRGGKGMVSLADLSSPTMSSPLTMQGQIMGTIQYMSPEQLEGRDIDTRADIFAFGSVLYEMLTGRRAFEGRSQASLIGAILDHDPPPVTSFQKVAPAMLDEIVKRCLAKDREERWQTARDLKRQLEWVASGNAAPIAAIAPPPPSVNGRTQMRNVGAGVLLGALITGGAVGWAMRPKAPAPAVVTRFELDLPDGQTFTRTGRHTVALSPDGARLVYVANNQLYLRAMHELSATPISGTEGLDPAEPVFSPDGQWLAFWSNDQLRKVPVTGGTPVTLCAAENPHGASWSGDRIFLGQAKPRGIVEVEANGGTPKLVVTLDEKKDELAHGPQLIAGGRAMLFTLRTGPGSWDNAAIVVQNLSTGERKVLVSGGRDAKVLASRHLVYSRDGTLFAMPFDEATLSTTGGAAPVQEEVLPGVGLAAMQIAFSASGSLALIPGTGQTNWELAWFDRQGREDRLPAPPRNYGTTTGSAPFDVSPDGTKLAVRINDSDRATTGRASVPAPANTSQAASGNDIWIFDIPRGTLTRLTFNGNAGYPLWTRDGRRVCYTSADEVLCQAADGTGSPQSLVKAAGLTSLKSFSPDGKQAVLTVRDPKTDFDVVTTTIGPPVETRPLIQTAYSEHSGALSPDGRFLAYASNETGRFEVYVRPYPSVDQGRWQISIEGGAEPRWAKSGRELFFSNFGGQGLRPDEPAILSVAVQPGPAFVAGRPGVVVKRPETAGSSYDVAPDGRFLFTVPPKTAAVTRPKIIVVQNWFDELRARVPVPSR